MADDIAVEMVDDEPLPDDPTERAIAIAERITKTQKHIVAQQGRTKRYIRLVSVGIALDLTLSVVFVFLAVNAAHVSAQIHRTQLNGCAIGNQFRAGQVALWDHVIAVSKAPPHETAAARKARLATLAAFRSYIAGQFKPADCHKLYP